MSAGHGHAYVPYAVIDALPLIADVVEAAERAVWAAENGQSVRAPGILRQEVAHRLTALREHLEGGD